MNFEIARKKMVQEQLACPPESSGRQPVRDRRVLEAMRTIPRHIFVQEAMAAQAYGDTSLPIGEKQTISQPYMVALMTEMLELEGTEKVLEIGTGSGYQAAVLGRIAGHVFTIEIHEALARLSQARAPGAPVQFGIYVSPVLLTDAEIKAKLGETFGRFYALNPMVGVIDGFQWSLLAGQTPLDWTTVLTSALVVTALLVSGTWYLPATTSRSPKLQPAPCSATRTSPAPAARERQSISFNTACS